MELEELQQQLAQLKQTNASLTARMARLERVEKTLNAVLAGTATQTGDDFFVSLVKHIAAALEAKYALVGVLSGPNHDLVQTIAFWQADKPGNNFNYELAGSPCANVIESGLQYYANGVQTLFPDDPGLATKQIECYIGAPIVDAAGEPLGILAVMHDKVMEMAVDSVPIVELFAKRAGAELERKRSEEILRESESRYRRLVEQSNEVIFLLYNGRFELVNRRFCELFEVTLEEIYSGKVTYLDLITPEYRQPIQEGNQQLEAGQIGLERYELYAQTHHGRVFPVEVSVSYLDYRGGKAVQGLVRDLTEQKRAENAERTQRELAEALHEIGLALSASLEVETVLDLLLDQLGRVVPYDTATVIEVQGNQTHIVRARGYEKFDIPLNTTEQPRSLDVSEALTWQKMIATKRPLIIPDIDESPLWRPSEFNPHTRSWASAPVLVGSEVVAFLSTNKVEPDFYTQEHGQRLSAFAAQAALALQNAQLFAEANARAEALRITGDILRALNAASNIQDAFPILVEKLQAATGCGRVTLAQLDESGEWAHFIALHDSQNKLQPPFRLHTSQSAASDDLVNGRIHIVPDIATELDFRAGQLLYRDGYRAYIALPLLVNEETKGVFTLSWTQENGCYQADLALLQQIASVVALGLERSQLFAKTHTRTQELNLLNKVISAAASGQREEQIKKVFCQEVAQYLDVDHVSLLEVDETLTSGMVTAQYLQEPAISLVGRTLMLETTSFLLTAVTESQAPVAVPNLAHTTLTPGIAKLIEKYHLVSALLAPIPLRGSLIGIMGIGSSRPRIFNPEEIRLTQTVCEELGRILETARLYDQLRNHAAELEEYVQARTSELAEANEQLKELDALKSQFVSDVSHELRTPVTNLKLYLDLLEHKGPGLLPKYLPILQKQADRLGQLIQDILDLSRLDIRHRTVAGFEPVDLNNVAQDVIAAHQPRAEVAGLRLTFSAAPDLPLVLGDRNQLAQVVTNLLVNAISYTEQGSIEVQTSECANKKQICLSVKDTGIGIYDDDLSYLFNRFYRGQRARQSNIPGTGLGLAIAQEIVHLHGGHIEVYSVVNQGSTFRVYLPLARDVE